MHIRVLLLVNALYVSLEVSVYAQCAALLLVALEVRVTMALTAV